MDNTLRLLQPIPLLQLTALLQAIQLVDIQPLMAGRAMATAQDHPTSCAKLSERARLVTVAPTLSPMPNGKPLSSASGTAESASSAIAFRRTDYWLKPPECPTREARHEGIREELAAAVKKAPARPGLSFSLWIAALGEAQLWRGQAQVGGEGLPTSAATGKKSVRDGPSKPSPLGFCKCHRRYYLGKPPIFEAIVFGIRLSIATIGEQADNLEATARAAAYQDCHGHCKLPMPAFGLGCCDRCHRLLFELAHYFLDGRFARHGLD